MRANWRQKRQSQRKRGLILFLLGIGVLLDSGFWFPFPVTGLLSVGLSFGLLTLSGWYLKEGLGLPVKPVLSYLQTRPDGMSLKELEEFLGPEEKDSLDELLKRLEKKDWASRETMILELVESGEAREDILILLPRGKAKIQGLLKGKA